MKDKPNQKNEHIVILHGLARTHFSMVIIANFLKKQGYQVTNFTYQSRKETIPQIASEELDEIVKTINLHPPQKIHFVTHSMGGIIVRYYLSTHHLDNLGRVVMIAPPNKGSKLVNKLRSIKLIRKIMGPAFLQLSTDSKGILKSLPEPNYEVGIIAGKYDAKVDIESTKLKMMKDFYLSPHFHGFIMNAPDVKKATCNFLQHGKFSE